MKNDQLTAAKGSKKTAINKIAAQVQFPNAPFRECIGTSYQQMYDLIKIHYVTTGYINEWRDIFNFAPLHHSVNTDLSSTIAECYYLEDHLSEVQNLLEYWRPKTSLIKETCILVLNELIALHRKVVPDYLQCEVKFSRQTIIDILRADCITRRITNKIENVTLFGHKENFFGRNCELEHPLIDTPVYETIVAILDGGDCDSITGEAFEFAYYNNVTDEKEFAFQVNNLIDKLFEMIEISKKKSPATVEYSDIKRK